MENRMAMKTGIRAWIALSAAMLQAAQAGAPERAPDPKAVEIARAMMQAMGGDAAWQQARFVRFDFILKIHGMPRIVRAHLWDRQTGRYRLEDKSANEKPGVVLFNIRDRKGTAYVNGVKLEGAEAAAALNGAYRTHRMDVDWLALPWSWLSPGVHLKYAGEQSVKGQAYDVVDVTVDRAGAESTRYKTYVSRQTHRLEYCSVGAETSLWDWQYTSTGGVQLARDHTNTEKRTVISMGEVKILDKVDDGFLTNPGRRLAMLK
jgi:hypothetical protein